MSEVFVVTMDDGNVCCPAFVIRGVFSTRAIADSFISADLARARRRDAHALPDLHVSIDEYFVDVWTIDDRGNIR